MKARLRRRLSWAVGIGGAAGGVALCIWAAVRPMPMPPSDAGAGAGTIIETAGSQPTDAARRVAELDAFAVIWERGDPGVMPDPEPEPVKTAPPPPPPPPPPLHVRLLATATEDGQSRAVVRNGEGEVVVVSIGDLIEGARLERIEARRVVFNHAGREVEMTLPEDEVTP